MSIKTQKTKYAALITYVIVLICMVLSFFIPVFDNGKMLLRELPGAFCAAAGKSFESSTFFVSFGLTSYYTKFNAAFNLAAWAVVLYSVVTVLGLIALFVMLLSKKTAHTTAVLAYTVEILAILSLLLFVYDRLTLIALGNFDALTENYQMGGILLAVLAVIWFGYTLQSIWYKHGAGFAKSLLFLLSLAALVCLFLNEAAYQTGWINDLADLLNASYCFIGNYAAFSLLNDAREALASNVTYAFAFITVIIVLINTVIDAVAIALNSNKVSKTFNLVRYGAELVMAIVTAIVGALNGITPGIFLYALMAVALLQIVLSTIRMFTRASIEEAAEYGYDDYDDADETAAAPAAEAPKPALSDGFYEAPDSTAVPPPVFTRSYAYQDDSFLNSLTPSERAEFYAIFIDKRRGNFYFLPEYEIGGDNKDFFQSLFIYLGKIMGSLSDGLMNKIYCRLNMMT